LDYLTFDIEIGQGEAQHYPVRVISSPAGEARNSMYLPMDEHLQLLLAGMKQAIHRLSKGRDSQLSIVSPEEQTVRELGIYLFDTLIASEIRSLYDVSREIAKAQKEGLRIRLRIHDALMSTLPWEFLHDARSQRSICLSNTTPFVRYLELPQSVPSLKIQLPLHIRGMIANSKEQEPLNVAREKLLMHEALQPLEIAGLVKLTWIDGQSWQALQQAFSHGTWHVFHFIGHATYNEQQKAGSLSLVNDDDGDTFDLPASKLGNILADHSSLRFVFLNACEGARSGTHNIYSGIAQTLMQQGIPAILGMSYEISDSASIELARTFYRELSYGMPVDAAVNEARKAVDMAMTKTLQWGTPVLYMRSPDGVLFDVDSKEIHSEPVATSNEQPQLLVTDNTRGVGPTEQQPFKQGDLIYEYDTHANWVSAVAWSPDGTRIASSGGDATIRIWNPTSGDNILTYHGQSGRLSEVLAVAWSPDSTRIASGGNRATIQVWDASNKQLRAKYEGHSKFAGVPYSAHVFWAAWSPDGKSIASTSINLGLDKAVHIWNSETGNLIRKFDLHAGWFDTSSSGGLAWSPDGTRIAAGMTGEVRIYNVTTGTKLLTYKQQSGYISTVAWSPDGERIASMNGDSVHIWNATTGDFYYAYRGHTDSLRDVAWSPDGHYLASASNDRSVQIWTTSDGIRIFTYTGHLDDVGAVSWAPDSRRIASASKDKTVHIWQAIGAQ
jgi:WD40 repeat protein